MRVEPHPEGAADAATGRVSAGWRCWDGRYNGTGLADLLAVESTGRLVVIEVKLAENAESRRAVVAQVLSYAGYLQGLDPEQLESQILGRHLEAGGSVLAAMQAAGHRDPG